MMSSTSSSAFSTSMTLMATSLPVFRSILQRVSHLSSWRFAGRPTLCTPFQSCPRLRICQHAVPSLAARGLPMHCCFVYSVVGSTEPLKPSPSAMAAPSSSGAVSVRLRARSEVLLRVVGVGVAGWESGTRGWYNLRGVPAEVLRGRSWVGTSEARGRIHCGAWRVVVKM
jgi:hypothetical protein